MKNENKQKQHSINKSQRVTITARANPAWQRAPAASTAIHIIITVL